jgi:hypothetical protein
MKKFIYNRISLAFFLTLLATTTKAVEPQPRPDLEAEAITRQQQRDEALQKQLQPEAVVQIPRHSNLIFRPFVYCK